MRDKGAVDNNPFLLTVREEFAWDPKCFPALLSWCDCSLGSNLRSTSGWGHEPWARRYWNSTSNPCPTWCRRKNICSGCLVALLHITCEKNNHPNRKRGSLFPQICWGMKQGSKKRVVTSVHCGLHSRRLWGDTRWRGKYYLLCAGCLCGGVTCHFQVLV